MQLVVIYHDELVFYTPLGRFNYRYAPKTVEKLEIVSRDLLSDELQKFFNEKKIPRENTVFILDESVLFRKELIQTDQAKKEEEINFFLSEIPLDQGKVVFKVLENNGHPYLVGTNRQLFQDLSAIFREFGIPVKKIIPSSATWVGEINEITAPEILRNLPKLKSADFLDHELDSNTVKTRAVVNNSFNPYLFFLIILITALISGGAIFYFGNLKNVKPEKAILKPVSQKPAPNTTKPANPQVSPSVIPTATPPVKMDRAVFKIRVLNGSGGDGVASKAKDLLEEKGYVNIETGNAGKYDYENTVIEIKNNKDLFNLLENDLKAGYEINKTPGVLETDSPYDAVIIIGLK